jgi:hypothetical protein
VNSSGRFRPKATPCRPGPAVRPANGAKAAVWVEHGHRACTCGAARWRPRHRCAGGLGGVRFSPLAQARHGRGARQVHEGESSPECPIDDGGVKVAVVAVGSCSKGGDRGGEVHGGAAEKGLGGMAHRRGGAAVVLPLNSDDGGSAPVGRHQTRARGGGGEMLCALAA